MQSQNNESKVTVQGVNNPVPAAEGGEKAGPRSSISSYCNINNNNNNNGENVENYNTLSGSSEAADAPTANPFARSSVTKRTPPDGIGTGNRKQIQTSTVEPATVQTPMNQTTVNQQKSEKDQKDTFTKLGVLIVDLMKFFKGRNNIHNAIKDQVRQIRRTYNELRNERMKEVAENNKSGMEAQAPQQTPAKKDAKRDREIDEETPKSTAPKRQKRSPKKKNQPDVVQEEIETSDTIHTW